MIILSLFRFFFVICAVFILLVLVLAASLVLRIRFSMRHSPMRDWAPQNSRYPDGSQIIEGEYKVIDEPRKE